jgi:hypothetical protein
MSAKNFYVSFGELKLIHEDWYLRALGPGWTKRSFRAWMRNLRVPIIHTPNGAYIRLDQFHLAVGSVSMLGQKDHFTPGIKNRKASKMDMTRFHRDLKAIIRDLLWAKGLSGIKLKAEVRKAASEASAFLLEAGLRFLPSRVQSNHEGFLKHQQEKRRAS